MTWKISFKDPKSDHEEEFTMPNCCDKGNGVCGKCGCCDYTYCDVCNEPGHEGQCEFMKDDRPESPLDIKHYKSIDGKWVEQND
jgi:hypothetical protein